MWGADRCCGVAVSDRSLSLPRARYPLGSECARLTERQAGTALERLSGAALALLLSLLGRERCLTPIEEGGR